MAPTLIVHCWDSGPETEDGWSTTCMLLDGHEGSHEWTRDDEIQVAFEDAASEASLQEIERLRAALRQIKGMVCGERVPRWTGDLQTTVTRGAIADIVDAATLDSQA